LASLLIGAADEPDTNRKDGTRLSRELSVRSRAAGAKSSGCQIQTIVLQGGNMASSENSRHDRKSPSARLTRREFLPLLGVTAMASIAPRALAAASSDMSKSKPSDAAARFVYVGTYTAPGVPPGGTHPSTAVGIYVFRMDPSDGALTQLQIVPASNPSYLAIDPAQTHLYSVNEDVAGRVSAYTLNQSNGALGFINTASASGRFTTHISVHPTLPYLFAANYGDLAAPGSFPAFRINANGSVGAMTALFQSVGYGPNGGPNADRQETNHAHQILSDFGGNHVFAVDLGADKVNILNLDAGTGALMPNTVPFAPLASGSGPRHMAFHPDRKHAYVLDELVSSVTVFNYDPTRGAFIWAQTISTLPDDFTGNNTTAEIRVHPSGRFLYNTNRGHNSVTMFEIDEDTGKLDVIGWESTRGEWPRGMNIDPSGTFLYAANQNTDTIAVFHIQPSNGKLKFSTLVHTPTPVDVEFGPAA
jgi:6-phosphogluconolactonase